MKTIFKALKYAAAAALLVMSSGSIAQSYPSKPIRFIVGYTAGGNNDILARVVAQKLSEELGQPVIVENKPGAEARIASEYVAKSAPDGYTLLIGATGPMVYAPGLYPSLNYDPIKDFAPITLLGSTPLVFAVNSKVPAKSMKELLALTKAQSEKTFYSYGATPFYVAAEFFKKQAGMNFEHVAYKGNVQAVQAAVTGEVPVVVADVPTAITQVRAGALRALAVTSSVRSKYLPDTPTMMESGWDFEGNSWTGLFAPAGTPRPVIAKLYEALSVILRSKSIQDRFAKLNFETTGIGMPPAEFAAMHKQDLARWTKATHELNIRGE
jgi:tripartite-type tricarboxylate transporter receptor subunit TctC